MRLLHCSQLSECVVQDFPSSANLGVYDAFTCLQWVQQNIGYFGGDVNRITIWGQSSGGMTAGLLMLSPLTDGLFTSVIMDSAPLPLAATDCSNSEKATLRWINQTECVKLPLAAQLVCLQNLTLQQLYNAVDRAGQTVLLGPPDWTIQFSPCVDGILISQPPLAVLLQGKYKSVPVLAGFNSDEGAYFTMNAVDPLSPVSPDFFKQYVNLYECSRRQCRLMWL